MFEIKLRSLRVKNQFFLIFFNIFTTVRQIAKVKDVFRIFASMAHGATFGELCVRFNPAALNINEKQLVLFGLLEGLIRSVNRVIMRL